MIVRNLLISLGVKSDLAGLQAADRQIQKTTGLSQGLGSALSMAMGQLAAQAATAFVGEMQKATEEALKFQKTLGQIQSLIPGNTARAKEYRQEIGRLAVEFGSSADDLGQGVYDVLSTFGDTADTVKLLEIATKAGAAGNAKTSDGIAVLTALTKAYGDTSVDTAQRVSDLAFQTVNLGVVTLPELASSMGKATPLAATLGVKMDELFAIMASATGVTGGGAEVATQMASLMRGLTDRSKDADRAFKIAFKADRFTNINQAIGKYGLVGVVEKLAATTDGTAESLNALFGRAEATTIALQLTGKGADDFKAKLLAMKGAAGATDTAYKAMTGGMASGAKQVETARAKTEQMRLELGDGLIPALLGWEDVQARIYKGMSDTLLPMLKDPTFFSFGGQVDLIAEAFSALGAIVAVVANGIDLVVTGMKQSVQVYKAMGALVGGDYETFKAEMDIGGYIGQDAADRMQRRTEIGFGLNRAGGMGADQWSQIRDQAKAEAAADRAKRAAMIGSAGQAVRGAFGGQVGDRVLNSQIGAVNVNVAVPPGTTASAAARIGDVGSRVLLQQFLAGAQRAYPVETPTGAAESDW